MLEHYTLVCGVVDVKTTAPLSKGITQMSELMSAVESDSLGLVPCTF